MSRSERNPILFSVVTVALNDLEGLKRTHQSIRAQTFRDFEWLVIDGLSTDGTPGWLAGLAMDRMQWWSEADEGLYDAMNKGIDRAAGQYLLFLNAGDELASETVLERVANTVAERPIPDFVFGDAIDITADERALYRKARSAGSIWWTMFACHQAMFFRRERIGEVRYRLRYPNAADYAFLTEVLDDGGDAGKAHIVKLEWPVCRFRLGGRSWETREETLRQDFEIRDRYLQVPRAANWFLFLLHRVHTWLKRRMPGLTRWLRGQRELPPVQ